MIELRELTLNDEAAFLEGLKELQGEDPHWYSFTWTEGMSFPQMIKILQDESAGLNLAPGRVQHSMLYAFLNGKIIGRLSVRYTLNENLRRRGGHLGYWVAKNYRNLGYATQIVRKGLDFCRLKKINPIMISCADNNTASWKIIEKIGGKLEDKIWDDVDKEQIRRYWLSL